MNNEKTEPVREGDRCARCGAPAEDRVADRTFCMSCYTSVESCGCDPDDENLKQAPKDLGERAA